MGVKCGEIIDFMERLAPVAYAEEYDNVGLILGSKDREIKKILLCLDVTEKIIKEALESDVQLIISHHPLIFKKLVRINEDEYKGSLIYRLIKADICVYGAHTNLDVTCGGVNVKLAERLGLSDVTGLKNNHSQAEGYFGLGATGRLKEALSLEGFVSVVKRSLEVESVRVVGSKKGDIGKVAVFCGSFDDDLETVLSSGADILVTGDLKYHTAVDALGMGMCIVDAGHFNTEKVMLPALREMLEHEFPAVGIINSKLAADPFKTY